MYGFSPELDTNLFRNQRLNQVCFGQNDLILHFDEAIELGFTITSSIGTGKFSEEKFRSNDFKQHATTLLECLDKLTTSAEVVGEKALRIGFSNGYILEIYDDSDQYESLVICYSGKTIVV
jgi:hypothetical protein